MGSRFELRRKIFHIVFGIAIIILALAFSNAKWILFYALVLGIFLSILSIFFKIPVISFMLEKFERPHYIKTFPGKGPLFFLAGSLLVLKLFSKDIALASIAILTLSDPLFSFDKRIFNGMFKIKNLKSVLLGLIAGTIAASFFVPLLKAFIAAFCAMMVESIAIFLGTDPVDDNIIMQITAGTVLYLLPL